MTAFTIILFTVILLCILAGIGGGFYMAFSVTSGRPQRPRKNKPVSQGEKPKQSHKSWLDRPWASKGKRLSTKIHNQDGQSFAEFGCQFTGEDPEQKLRQARGTQDESYNCLNTEPHKLNKGL